MGYKSRISEIVREHNELTILHQEIYMTGQSVNVNAVQTLMVSALIGYRYNQLADEMLTLLDELVGKLDDDGLLSSSG